MTSRNISSWIPAKEQSLAHASSHSVIYHKPQPQFQYLPPCYWENTVTRNTDDPSVADSPLWVWVVFVKRDFIIFFNFNVLVIKFAHLKESPRASSSPLSCLQPHLSLQSNAAQQIQISTWFEDSSHPREGISRAFLIKTSIRITKQFSRTDMWKFLALKCKPRDSVFLWIWFFF